MRSDRGALSALERSVAAGILLACSTGAAALEYSPFLLTFWPKTSLIEYVEESRIRDASVNIGFPMAYAGNVGMFQASLYSAAVHEMKGVQMGLANTAESMKGVQMNIAPVEYPAMLNWIEKDFTGIQYGLMNIVRNDFTGIQVSLFINSVANDFKGIQVGALNENDDWDEKSGLFQGLQAGMLNQVENFYGLQLGVFSNRVRNMKGFQAALINNADEIHGVQAGALNVCRKLKGIQLGVINIIKEGEIPVFMGINAGWQD